MQISNSKAAELRGATASDDELVLFHKYIISGFPMKQRDLPTEIRKYFPYRDEVSVENGLIVKGEQLVIPVTLRSQYLDTIHEGHRGITRCQATRDTLSAWIYLR